MVEYADLISSILLTADTNADGMIDYNELLAATVRPTKEMTCRWSGQGCIISLFVHAPSSITPSS